MNRQKEKANLAVDFDLFLLRFLLATGYSSKQLWRCSRQPRTSRITDVIVVAISRRSLLMAVGQHVF